MAEEKNTQFNYLLNAMERAGQEAHPAKAGYAGKRKALMAHVRELERKVAEADAAVAAERERCASLLPTSWLDPLLTGKDGLGQPPYYCPDIERLLSALAAAIRAGNAGVAASRLPWDAQPGCHSCGRAVGAPCTDPEGCQNPPAPRGVGGDAK